MAAGSFTNKTGHCIKHREAWFKPDPYGICWGKGDTEIVGVAKQWLVQPETLAIRVSPPLTLPRMLVLRSLMAQRPN